MLVIQVEKLSNGQFVARPQNCLGSMGWSPFPWTAVFGSNPSHAYSSFIDQHLTKIGDMETSMHISD